MLDQGRKAMVQHFDLTIAKRNISIEEIIVINPWITREIDLDKALIN